MKKWPATGSENRLRFGCWIELFLENSIPEGLQKSETARFGFGGQMQVLHVLFPCYFFQTCSFVVIFFSSKGRCREARHQESTTPFTKAEHRMCVESFKEQFFRLQARFLVKFDTK